jgi:hypothetical protein
LVVIEPPHHRSPPQRIASEQQNHCSAEPPTTFATKSTPSGHCEFVISPIFMVAQNVE